MGCASSSKVVDTAHCPQSLGEIPGGFETIVYVSRRAEEYFQDPFSLTRLVRFAEANNQRIGISGYLVVAGPHFLQRLEGPIHEMQALLASLQADPRHDDFLIVERKSIPAPMYAEWAMRTFELSAALGSVIDANAFMLQALSRGLVVGKRTVPQAVLSHILSGTVPDMHDTCEVMIIVTIGLGSSLVSLDTAGRVNVNAMSMGAILAHLQKRLCPLRADGRSRIILFGGQVLQFAVPVDGGPRNLHHKVVRACIDLATGQGHLPNADVSIVVSCDTVWEHYLQPSKGKRKGCFLHADSLSLGFAQARALHSHCHRLVLDSTMASIVADEFLAQPVRLFGQHMHAVLVHKSGKPMSQPMTRGCDHIPNLCETAVALLASQTDRPGQKAMPAQLNEGRSFSLCSVTNEVNVEWMYQLDALKLAYDRKKRRGCGSPSFRQACSSPQVRCGSLSSPTSLHVSSLFLGNSMLDHTEDTADTYNGQLLSIVYLSRMNPLSPMTSAEIRQLGCQAAENNFRQNVTGFLAVTLPYFLQFLEGPAEAVKRLFARISEDPRHQGVTVLVSQVVSSRTFEGWSMQLVDLDETNTCEMAPIRELMQLLAWQFSQLSPWLPRLENDLLLSDIQPCPGANVQCSLVAFAVAFPKDECTEVQVSMLLHSLDSFFSQGGELVGFIGHHLVGYAFSVHLMMVMKTVLKLCKDMSMHAGVTCGNMLLLNAGPDPALCKLAFYGPLFEQACQMASEAAHLEAAIVAHRTCKVELPSLTWHTWNNCFFGSIEFPARRTTIALADARMY